ncbi:MAG: hypothetical protein JXA90_01395, partial [Planctomycetes bacterium]|nr:hypothetical protein [Planctomycetota bacterium]
SGYYMDSAEEYLRAAHEMRSWRGGAIRLVSPENRPRYRRQVQAGFGFYLDMFLNEPTSRYYRGPIDGSRLARLERNLAFARDAADEYVWVYGEQCRWWGPPLSVPKSVGKGRLWEEAMPGITRAIAYVRDPVSAARGDIARLRAAGSLVNLARNADFAHPASEKEDALPAEFGAWQDEKTSSGELRWDAAMGGGAARAAGVLWGCFIQPHEVAPGEMYAACASCLSRCASHPTLVVRWQTAEGRWTRESDDRTFVFRPCASPATAVETKGATQNEDAVETPIAADASIAEKKGGAVETPGAVTPQTDEWQRAFGVVTVPPGAGKLVILLSVTGQAAEADVCWFDDLALYRLGGIAAPPAGSGGGD